MSIRRSILSAIIQVRFLIENLADSTQGTTATNYTDDIKLVYEAIEQMEITEW